MIHYSPIELYQNVIPRSTVISDIRKELEQNRNILKKKKSMETARLNDLSIRVNERFIAHPYSNLEEALMVFEIDRLVLFDTLQVNSKSIHLLGSLTLLQQIHLRSC